MEKEITNKTQLQRKIMTESNKFWNVNDLTEVIRAECKKLKLKTINHSTVERTIRKFREDPDLVVEKNKTSANTFVYRVTKDQPDLFGEVS